jgi:hypothetical protein
MSPFSIALLAPLSPSMNTHLQHYVLKYQLGDRVLWRQALKVLSHEVRVADAIAQSGNLGNLVGKVPDDVDGLILRCAPIETQPRELTRTGALLTYPLLSYPRRYIRFEGSLDAYQASLSAKTRSHARQAVKKLQSTVGDNLSMHVLSAQGDLDLQTFRREAIAISRLTYQARLLGAGLPERDAYWTHLQGLADSGRLCAHLMRVEGKPIAYVLCTVDGSSQILEYLGYDPDYAHLSIGGILLRRSIEAAVSAGDVRYYDFGEGDNQYKKQLATDAIESSTILCLRDTLRHRQLLMAHRRLAGVSAYAGAKLAQWGLKAQVKRWIRST